MFQRSIINIRTFPQKHLKHPELDGYFDIKGNLVDETDEATYHFGKWNTGEIIAVIEKEGQKHMHLGRVVNSRGRHNKIHVYATTGKKNRKRIAVSRLPHEATFVKAFIDTNDQKMILGERHARRYPTKPYTWTINHDHKQVVAIGLQLTVAGKLAKDSVKKLPPGFKFHVS